MKTKNYLLRGGLTGFLVTLVILVIVELSTVCHGYGCNTGFWARLPDKGFLVPALETYALFLIGGIILGIILGWIIAKIRSNK